MIPVSLDAGTDNQALRGDPFYLGSRRARRRGQDYHAFIGRYVQTVSKLFPAALLQFEAIDPETARQILTPTAAATGSSATCREPGRSCWPPCTPASATPASP